MEAAYKIQPFANRDHSHDTGHLQMQRAMIYKSDAADVCI